MLESAFNNGLDLFDRRFVTNAYIPMLLASTGLAVVLLSGTGNLDPAITTAGTLNPVAQAAMLLGWMGASWFMAGMLWNSRYSVTRLFEGYPLRRCKMLCRRQRNRAEIFEASDRYKRYPMRATDFLPTSFGNVMRASEFYGHERYGLDLILIWPRLAEVAPDRYRSDVDQARSEYEFLLCLSLLGTVFGIMTGVFLAIFDGPLVVYFAAVPSTLALGFLSYRLAVFAAMDFGDQLRVVVDMYRLDVLAALGWPIPKTEEEERATWGQVNEFLGQGDVPDVWPTRPPHLVRRREHPQSASD